MDSEKEEAMISQTQRIGLGQQQPLSQPALDGLLMLGDCLILEDPLILDAPLMPPVRAVHQVCEIWWCFAVSDTAVAVHLLCCAAPQVFG